MLINWKTKMEKSILEFIWTMNIQYIYISIQSTEIVNFKIKNKMEWARWFLRFHKIYIYFLFSR